LSDGSARVLDPALALLEFDSIAAGIVAADAMVKASPIGTIYSGTVQPGKYLVLVSGDTASVEESIDAGADSGGASLVDSMFLPDVHPSVSAAVVSAVPGAGFTGEALGIVETASVAAVLASSDAGVKAAAVDLIAIRMADGLGGKGYALYSGPVAEVEAALEAASEVAAGAGALLRSEIVPQLHEEVAANIERELRFGPRVRSHGAEDG
jgi:microcompartment protein CcmL/EutN